MTSGGGDTSGPATEPGASLIRDRRVQGLVGTGVVAGFVLGMLIFGSPWHLPPAWGDIPTWITAIATVLLAIFAIVTAMYARRALGEQRKAFDKQAEEVAILAAQNEREAAERRRDQASRVYLAAPRESRMLVSPSAVNGSDLPVHDARIWYADPGGLSGPEDFGMIMPKEAPSARRKFSAPSALTHTILTFRDASGVRWVRMPDGTFDEQRHPTARDSILASLGRPLPAAEEPAAAAGPAGQR